MGSEKYLVDIEITPSEIDGVVEAPPSKSYTHRCILAGGLGGKTTVLDPLRSEDTEATLRCCRMLGAEASWEDKKLVIDGFKGSPVVPGDVLDCGNSGTTIRLLTGTCSLVDGFSVLTGDESLRDRPNQPLIDSLNDLGCSVFSTRGNGKPPIVVEGPIEGGMTEIDASISSQFVSSLLFVGPASKKGVEVNIKNLKSKPYVDMTIEVLEDSGIDIEKTKNGFYIEGNQSFSQDTLQVPGDFSSASYLMAAGALTGNVEIENLFDDAQGDSKIIDLLDRMGVDIEWKDGMVKASKTGELNGIGFDGSDNPDLVPTIAVLGMFASGNTKIENVRHLRYKEVDRLEAISEELRKLGVDMEEGKDYLIVKGNLRKKDTSSIEIDSRGDHRIAMAFSLVGLVSGIKIKNAECINISYPSFIEDIKSLGGNIKKIPEK